MCRAYTARPLVGRGGRHEGRWSGRSGAYGGAPPFEREDKERIRAEYKGLNDRVEFLERMYAAVRRSTEEEEEGGAITAVGQELAEARAARDATVLSARCL